MFLIATRNFPPELGGMQMLMGGLSKSLQNYGQVKIFAEEHKNSASYDEKFKNNITRVSGFKFLRKFISYLFFNTVSEKRIKNEFGVY